MNETESAILTVSLEREQKTILTKKEERLMVGYIKSFIIDVKLLGRRIILNFVQTFVETFVQKRQEK